VDRIYQSKEMADTNALPKPYEKPLVSSWLRQKGYYPPDGIQRKSAVCGLNGVCPLSGFMLDRHQSLTLQLLPGGATPVSAHGTPLGSPSVFTAF